MTFLFSLGIATARTLVDGWAIWTLWSWFIVPLGMPHIGYWNACGFDLFIGTFFLFAAPRPANEDDEIGNLGFAAGKVLLSPLVVGIGFLIQLGMH